MPAERRGEVPRDGPSLPIVVPSCRQVSADSRQFTSTCMPTGYTLSHSEWWFPQGKLNKRGVTNSRSWTYPDLGAGRPATNDSASKSLEIVPVSRILPLGCLKSVQLPRGGEGWVFVADYWIVS